MKNKKLIIVAVFCGYIFFFFISYFVTEPKEFSNLENRKLSKLPEFNKESVISASYMKDLESYMNDQIASKDAFVRHSVSIKYAWGNSLINGVYYFPDGRYIQDFKLNRDQLEKNIGLINDFVEKNPQKYIYFLLVPNASYVYQEEYECPASDSQSLAISLIKDQLSSEVKFIDISDELRKDKSDMLYFKTDHHWSQAGAYIGYKAICDEMGVKANDSSHYEIKTYPDFYGSLYSKVPVYMAKGDDFSLYLNKDNVYNVEIPENNSSFNDVYNYDNLSKKDMYTTYLDGNHAMVHITSEAENKEKILVVKDSYAHALIPFLVDTYGDIYMLDLRYFHNESVTEFMEKNEIKKLIFIYNIDFINSDDNFGWLY